jgi:hypothetical protein
MTLSGYGLAYSIHGIFSVGIYYWFSWIGIGQEDGLRKIKGS